MFFIPMLLIFILNKIDTKRIRLLLTVLFDKKYFYQYKPSTLLLGSIFYVLNFMLICCITTLFFWRLVYRSDQIYTTPLSTLAVSFCCVFVCFVVKRLVNYLIYASSQDKDTVKRIEVVESSYLVSVLVVGYPFVVYDLLHLHFNIEGVFLSMVIGCLLWGLRFVLILIHNKNLMSGKWLYFILYLCTLEILPFIVIINTTYP